MEPIFDRHGKTVAFRRRDYIYDLDGKAAALIRQRALFTFDGEYRGRAEDGFYRDSEARAVAFEAGATGGPLPPVPKRDAIAPQPQDIPHPPQIESVPPAPHFRPNTWSDRSWDELLRVAESSSP